MKKSDVIKEIKASKKVAIFGHKNPDPDSYGAMFSMREICMNFGLQADVYAKKSADGYLDAIFPLTELKTDFIAKDYDLVIVVDLHGFDRLNSCFVEEVKKAKRILCIDHHEIVDGENVVSKKIWDEPQRAATCEIIANMLIENKIETTPTLATYLWTGLIGDTGRFLHTNLSKNVLDVAGWLYERGAKVQDVYNSMYRRTTLKQLEVHKKYINKIVFMEDGKVGYVVFTLKDIKKLGVERDDIKKYVDEVSRVEGIIVSFLAIETRKNHFKFSIRTKGYDSIPISSRFGGGGHKEASGFDIDIKKHQIKRLMKELAKEISQNV